MKNSKPALRARFVVLLMIVSVAAQACGSSASPETSGPPASTAANGSGTASGDPIRIGAVFPLSGPFAYQGETTMSGARFAVEQINNAGGIESLGGAPMELVEADAGESPETAAASARQLIEGGIDGLVGAWLGSYTAAVAPLAETAQVPYVTEAFGDEVTSRGYVYLNDIDPPSSTLAGLLSGATIELADDAGYTLERVALGGDNSVSAVPLMDTLREDLPAAGVEIIVDEQWTSPLQDPSAFVSDVIANDPDAVFLIAFAFSDVQTILSTLRGAGYTGPVIQNGAQALVPAWLDVGDVVQGLTTQVSYGPVAGTEELVADMTEFTGDPYIIQDHFLGYIDVMTLKEGFEAAGSRDPLEVAEAIRALDLSSGSLAELHPLGSFSFDDSGRIDGEFAVMQQWQTVNEELSACVVWPIEQKTCDMKFEP